LLIGDAPLDVDVEGVADRVGGVELPDPVAGHAGVGERDGGPGVAGQPLVDRPMARSAEMWVDV
jgi:hypothetical protein